MINTRKVTDRRLLHFSTMNEILEDVEYLAAGDPPRAAGNWTPAQVVDHVAKIIRFAVDGFPMPKAALPIRILGRLLRQRALTRPMQPGFRLPKKFQFMAPDPGVTWDDAVDRLRAAIERAGSQRMKHPSPVLGKLAHEQWELLHCRHAELHLSFLHPA